MSKVCSHAGNPGGENAVRVTIDLKSVDKWSKIFCSSLRL